MVQYVYMEKENKFPYGVDNKVIREGDSACKHEFFVSDRSREKKCKKCPLVLKDLR